MDVTGYQGELIDRLLALLAEDEGWAKLGFWVAAATGGHELQRVFVEAEDEPASGTSSKSRRRRGKDECLAVLRRRLLSLVGDGVKEGFLVRSPRDEVSFQLTQFSDPVEIEERFADRREWLAEAAAHPEMVGRIDPETAAAAAAAAAAPTPPVGERFSADEVGRRLAKRLEWDRAVAEALPDRVIDLWEYAESHQRTAAHMAQLRRRVRQ